MRTRVRALSAFGIYSSWASLARQVFHKFIFLGMTNEHSEIKSFSLAQHEQMCRTSRASQLAVIRKQQQTLGEESDESEDDADEDEEYESSEDSSCFPIAISIKQRRTILKDAGCLVDNAERDDCQFIRNSREGKVGFSKKVTFETGFLIFPQ